MINLLGHSVEGEVRLSWYLLVNWDPGYMQQQDETLPKDCQPSPFAEVKCY